MFLERIEAIDTDTVRADYSMTVMPQFLCKTMLQQEPFNLYDEVIAEVRNNDGTLESIAVTSAVVLCCAIDTGDVTAITFHYTYKDRPFKVHIPIGTVSKVSVVADNPDLCDAFISALCKSTADK